LDVLLDHALFDVIEEVVQSPQRESPQVLRTAITHYRRLLKRGLGRAHGIRSSIVTDGLVNSVHDGFKVGRRLDDGAVQQNRFRKRVTPARARRASGRQIPEHAVVCTTPCMKLAGCFGFLDSRRNQMSRVPELSHPAIMKTIQHAGAG
jgi:hypothetical protein